MADVTTVPKTRTPSMAKPKQRAKPERPKLWKVVLVNDDVTPMEFVVKVLRGVFRMTRMQAWKAMFTAHRKGSCVIAVYTREVAEAKARQGIDAGQAAGYPLSFTTEREE